MGNVFVFFIVLCFLSLLKSQLNKITAIVQRVYYIIETFEKFKRACKQFLNKPSKSFFVKKSVYEDFKKYPNLRIVSIKTTRQAGDIAGTKSKKFFDFFVYSLKKEFVVKKQGFAYNESKNSAFGYLVLDKKENELIQGPPVVAVHNLAKFKKVHKKAFIKNHVAYVLVKHDLAFNKWLKIFKKKYKKIINQMDVKKVNLMI